MADQFASLEDELNSNTDGSSDSNDDSYDDPYGDTPILNVVPRVAIDFDEILEIGIMGGLGDEQNIRSTDRTNDGYFVLKNPSVSLGSLWAADEGQRGADYKLVNKDYDKIEDYVEKEGGEFVEKGIRQYGNAYESSEVDDFEEDIVRLMIGSSAGLRLLESLDVCGGPSAYYDDDGQYSGGLTEYPPGYGGDDHVPQDDGYERVATTPVLRGDMEGESGTLFFYFGDAAEDQHAMHKSTAFKGEAFDEDDEPIVDNVLSAASNQEAGRDDRDYVNLSWHDPDSDGSATTDSAEDDEENESFDDLDAVASRNDEGDEIAYSNLKPNQQKLVDNLADRGIHSDAEGVDDFEGILASQFDSKPIEAFDAADADRLVKEKV